MYMDKDEVLEVKEDYEAGLVSAWEFHQAIENWDGDPIEVIG